MDLQNFPVRSNDWKISKCKLELDKDEAAKLAQERFKQVKRYWNMLKQSANYVKQCPVSLTVCERYSSSINNPEDPFFTPDEDVIYFIERYERNEMDIMVQELNTPFSLESILKAIGQLNTNKCAGPDMFLNELFMHGKLILSKYLLVLFNIF